MNTSRKRTVLILTPVLVVALLGGFAWSHRAGGPEGRGERVHAERGEQQGRYHSRRHKRGGGQRFMSRMVEELGLNEGQTKAIKEVLLEARKKNIELRAEAKVARIELGQLMTAGEADKASVNAKVDQIASLRGDMLRQRTDAVLSVREILTPEQQAKADRALQRLLHEPRRHRGR